jgi:beta-1,4-mannosyl-glycoprotein beta-1,4-N-acetylglucosaminyltransferase
MKIFDCFMYFDEDIVLDVRLNFLNDYVDKFIIIESEYNHRGEKRKPKFNIKKFEKFKDKIIYILKKDIPFDVEEIDDTDNENEHYRKSIFNASKRENLQRNQILEGLKDLEPNDWVIISDLDEIPNLENVDFYNIKNKFLFFQQSMMYYKFNLKLDNFTWTGSRACKFKHLKSPQWLRNIKTKKFNWWRLDVLFSKNKYFDIKFIKDGGWHYSYLKSPEEIKFKLKSYLHHIDYDRNPLNTDQIARIIEDKKTIYDLKVDSKEEKFNPKNKLIKVSKKEMPKYINDNISKFKDWID